MLFVAAQKRKKSVNEFLFGVPRLYFTLSSTQPKCKWVRKGGNVIMTLGFFHVFPPVYVHVEFVQPRRLSFLFSLLCFFFFAGVLCGGANDTNGIVKCAGLRQGLDDFSVSQTSRPASHRLLESNSTLGANPWLTPFARCHESRPKNNSYNKKDCGVVVVVVVVAPSRNGRHPFDFHLGNCRRCWIASEKKSPGGRPSNKNLFFFPVEL
jgi:hypothetical protein